MATVIIDTSSNEGKRLIDYLKTIKYVRVVEDNLDDAANYNPDFVDKIEKRSQQPSVKLNINDLWK